MTRLYVPIVAALLALPAAGCLVRTTGHHHQHGGHAERQSDYHCHDRGGKHHKEKCHQHPHGPGHHD
jgi:hypothetical protein